MTIAATPSESRTVTISKKSIAALIENRLWHIPMKWILFRMIDSPIKSFRIRHHRGTLLFSFNFNLKLFMLCVSFRRLCTISAKQSHQFTVMWGKIRYSLSHWFVQRWFVLLIAHFIWISKSLTLSQCQRNTLENKRVLPHHFHNQIVDLICNWTAEKWRVWHVWHNNRIWRSYCANCMQFIGSFAIASAPYTVAICDTESNINHMFLLHT